MLVTPPFGASSNIALWRAYSKPPVELVVADLDHASEMDYTGMAYSVKRLAERGLLGLTTSAKPRHQDADTS